VDNSLIVAAALGQQFMLFSDSSSETFCFSDYC
jgi:hypothetical protein